MGYEIRMQVYSDIFEAYQHLDSNLEFDVYFDIEWLRHKEEMDIDYDSIVLVNKDLPNDILRKNNLNSHDWEIIKRKAALHIDNMSRDKYGEIVRIFEEADEDRYGGYDE